MTKSFPEDERFNLVSQIRRSAVSIPSNIAEGHGRGTSPEFVHFLNISYASSSELETQIIISQRLKLISDKEYNQVLEQLEDIRKMLTGLKAHFDKAKKKREMKRPVSQAV
jgi:four helix bundle protein